MTYDESGKSDAKDQSICTKNPNVIFALDDPFWKSNAHCSRLWSIRAVTFNPVLLNLFICQTQAVFEEFRY